MADHRAAFARKNEITSNMKDSLAIFTRRLCDGARDDARSSIIFLSQSPERCVFRRNIYKASIAFFQQFIRPQSAIVLWSMNAAALGSQHHRKPLSFDTTVYLQ